MSELIPDTVRERGYYPLSAYMRRRFGARARRIPLDAGLDCPNRDGTLGVEGCAFCEPRSFAPARANGPDASGKACSPAPVEEQMAAAMHRGKGGLFVAYFQSRTNTYAPVERLRALYDAATKCPQVVGLAIGTRPDCVPDATLDLIAEYARRLDVWVEYGLQTRSDATLARMRRGHGYAAFADAVRRTRERGVKVCAHAILGLPGEDKGDWQRTADALAENGVEGVKLHHLHIVKGTALEGEYLAGRVPVFFARGYARAVCDFLERLRPGTVVFRLVGESRDASLLLDPRWPEPKARVLALVEEEFRSRGTWQGARCAFT